MTAITFLKQILHDDRGATAIEYGLIAALLVIAMISALQALASETIAMWGSVQTKVINANSSA